MSLKKEIVIAISLLLSLMAIGCNFDKKEEVINKTKKEVKAKVEKIVERQVNRVKPLGPIQYYLVENVLSKCFDVDRDGTLELLNGKVIEVITLGIPTKDDRVIMDLGRFSGDSYAEIGDLYGVNFKKLIELNNKKQVAFIVVRGEFSYYRDARSKNRVHVVLKNATIADIYTDMFAVVNYLEKIPKDKQLTEKDSHLDAQRPQYFLAKGFVEQGGRDYLYPDLGGKQKGIVLLKRGMKFTSSLCVRSKNKRGEAASWYKVKLEDGTEGWLSDYLTNLNIQME